MSNIGKKPIYKPEKLSLELQKFGNVSVCWLSGPNYTLKQKISKELTIKMTSQQLYLLPSISKTATKFYKLNRILVKQAQNQNWSLSAIKFRQNIVGVLVGFKNFLRVRGVGYKFQFLSKKLVINVGYSHNLQIKLPLKHQFLLNKKSTFFRAKSSDLAKLSNFLSFVRNLRQPDVYKGKGIRYRKDPIKLKEGKKKKTA